MTGILEKKAIIISKRVPVSTHQDRFLLFARGALIEINAAMTEVPGELCHREGEAHGTTLEGARIDGQDTRSHPAQNIDKETRVLRNERNTSLSTIAVKMMTKLIMLVLGMICFNDGGP